MTAFVSVTGGTLASCQCERCINACRIYPGRMMPKEAAAAIDAGFADRLMRELLATGDKPDRHIWLLLPAAGRLGGKTRPNLTMDDVIDLTFGGRPKYGACVFLKRKRCTIHDSGFKPLQCRTALNCAGNSHQTNVDDVIRAWDTTAGRKVVRRWIEATQ